MAILERLTEEEAYLVAILTDPSGSELAEFAYRDEQSYGGRYRLWDMQWPYYHCTEKYQVDASGRGVGKSVSAVLRACAFPFNFPGQDMLVTAPQDKHLVLVTDKVEENLQKYRILREMLKVGAGGKSSGIRKNPDWQANFANGAKILSRLPGLTGMGVKGPHPLAIELDELQDFPRRGFTELTETIKISEPGAIWRCHGVSNGVGDIHYELTNQDKNAVLGDGDNIGRIPFFVHRYIAPHRPTWNDEERANKIALYKGEDNPNYIRNIFGEPGSASNPVFVLARLMACVRQDDVFNKTLYQHITIMESNRLRAERDDILLEDLVELLPSITGPEYTSFWGGMDVGFTTDPSEVLIFGTTVSRGKEVSRLILRMTLKQLKAADQLTILAKVFGELGPRLRRFAMDKTGNGRTITELASDLPGVSAKIVGYGFSEVRPVAFDDRPLQRGEKPEDLVIKKKVIKFATETIRKWVDEGLLELPYDTELLGQLQMMNLAPKGENIVEKTSGGADHAFDAIRMFVLAKALESIEAMLDKPARRESVLDQFF